MASQADLQALLRLLTTGRNKLPMLAAMTRIKALQTAGLRSISDISAADLPTIKKVLGDDEKAAKSLQTACKSSLNPKSSKRAAEEDSLTSSAKRKKTAYELDSEPQTPQEIEAALALPAPSRDEEEIARTVIVTNRAPLVLAFAVALLQYTMPEQPPSSRLSLAQAVVSVNSRSKAMSLGLERESAEQDGWGTGQPKVKVLGREIAVLKRGGYEWRAEKPGREAGDGDVEASVRQQEEVPASVTPQQQARWIVSEKVTLKKSTFVARAIEVASSSDARQKLSRLLESNPDLRDASHNITAFRIQRPGFLAGIVEECDDDGETGGGRHILKILKDSSIFGVLVVCTRWYGGIMLGPDRWTLMSQVVRDALSQRLRVAGVVTGREALWGLDLEAMKATDSPLTGGTAVGMPVHRAEGARLYILKAFASAPPAAEVGSPPKKKKTGVEAEREKERNLGLLLGSLELLFESWVEHITREELDRRAWGWYVRVRPEVESGAAGWGGKGTVSLKDILDLRRRG